MATRLLIDGYNLIAALWGMGGTSAERERQRNDLVAMLSDYAAVRGNPVEVIFDGWKDGEAFGSRTRDRGVEVTFSPKGVTADEVIRDTVREDSVNTVVISSDKRVQGWANSAGAGVVACRAFIGKLFETRAEAGEDEAWRDEDPGDHWAGHTKKKGNPRRPSKKARGLNRQLKKL